MNGPHHGLKIYTSPRSGRTPPWVKNLQVHEVNGPHHGLEIYTSSRSERTPPWVENIRVHEVNGPHHGLEIYTSSRSRRTQPGPNLYKSKKWTDPNSSWNYASPSRGQPSGVTTTFKRVNGPDWGRKQYEGPRRGRIKLSKYLKHQDGAHTPQLSTR